MTFQEAMAKAKAGYRVREEKMQRGWLVGWFPKARGYFLINPVTGSNYHYTPSDEDKRSIKWSLEAGRRR